MALFRRPSPETPGPKVPETGLTLAEQYFERTGRHAPLGAETDTEESLLDRIETLDRWADESQDPSQKHWYWDEAEYLQGRVEERFGQ